ncbi:MAG TPA: hypothetical protein VLJ79_24625 [Candidatus Binatia bacterium]|nr:hypothetical protein [Candidatus Binatia bacterium]
MPRSPEKRETPLYATTMFSLGSAVPLSMATGFWMAKEFGAFEKQGIHAELIYISSGPPQKYFDETNLTRATAVR